MFRGYDSFLSWLRYSFIRWIFFDLWRYDIPRFVVNIYRFKYSLWVSRPYDYYGFYCMMYDYIDMLRNHMRKCQRHTDWERDVNHMNRFLGILNQYMSRDELDSHIVEKLPSFAHCLCPRNQLDRTRLAGNWFPKDKRKRYWRRCIHNLVNEHRTKFRFREEMFRYLSNHIEQWWC